MATGPTTTVEPHFPRELGNDIILDLEVAGVPTARGQAVVVVGGGCIKVGPAAGHAEALARQQDGRVLVEGLERRLEQRVRHRGVGVDRGGQAGQRLLLLLLLRSGTR